MAEQMALGRLSGHTGGAVWRLEHLVEDLLTLVALAEGKLGLSESLSYV